MEANIKNLPNDRKKQIKYKCYWWFEIIHKWFVAQYIKIESCEKFWKPHFVPLNTNKFIKFIAFYWRMEKKSK